MSVDSAPAQSTGIFLPAVGEHFALDEEVMQCLPTGSKVVDAVAWGTLTWTKTAKITTELADGNFKTYFLKTATLHGAEMMEGEFNSLKTISDVIPSFAPTPYGWGKLKSSSDSYFLIMNFLNLEFSLPEPAKLCGMIADMHSKSVSPTGKFGFHVPTCQGKNIQPNTWTPSWTACFTSVLTAFYDEDMKANGPWPEYERAFDILRKTVIPQILDPLQADGRELKPCLVHGDLWEENLGIDVETGDPTVFDASCMYAHNEYELGMWRREVIHLGQTYFRHYMMRIPPSEPKEQWDDRNRLYSVKFNLSHSSHFPGATSSRDKIFEDVCFLVNKYTQEKETSGAADTSAINAATYVMNQDVGTVAAESGCGEIEPGMRTRLGV